MSGSRVYGPGYGRPTDENLAAYMAAYIRSVEPGGVNAHLHEIYGHIPYPNRAYIRDNNTGLIVARWAAPMFMAVGPQS